jgi:hypothetical protein
MERNPASGSAAARLLTDGKSPRMGELPLHRDLAA